MNKKILLMTLVLVIFAYFSINAFAEAEQVVQQKQQLKVIKKPIIKAYKFEVQGIKRIFTSPTKVKFQVQYYISPTYPKPCFISAYVPNKANQSPNFAYNPAGRLPYGVPKGQKHFTDNVTFEVNYTGSASYTSTTIEVVIYDSDRNLKTQIINWGQTWGSGSAAYRFEIQGIKRVFTSPTNVKFQVQYYISPTYPKPCFISAYVPNKANQSSKFSYNPAGRLPNGVPKGQKHFTDNVTFEVNYIGSGSYTSTTIEVVIYDTNGNLKTQIINWGQTWGNEPSLPDLIVSSIHVSKYNPYVKTTFTVNIKNIGGTPAGQADLSVWLYKLLPDGSEPSTPNEYWSGKVPVGGGTIAPLAIKSWTHDKYEFMTEGNWRVRAKINPFKTVTESNYNNNTYTYNFPIPN